MRFSSRFSLRFTAEKRMPPVKPADSVPQRKLGLLGPGGLVWPGRSRVPAPATRRRLDFEFLPTVRGAFPPNEVYIARRDFARALVVPLEMCPVTETGEVVEGGARPWRRADVNSVYVWVERAKVEVSC